MPGTCSCVARFVLTIGRAQVFSFSITYFALSLRKPPVDYAPLISSGLFGMDTASSNLPFIREEKYTVMWTKINPCGPSLMFTLNPLERSGYYPSQDTPCELGGEPGPQGLHLDWIEDSIYLIYLRWEQVLDDLDRQIALPVSSYIQDSQIASLIGYSRVLSYSMKTFETRFFLKMKSLATQNATSGPCRLCESSVHILSGPSSTYQESSAYVLSFLAPQLLLKMRIAHKTFWMLSKNFLNAWKASNRKSKVSVIV